MKISSWFNNCSEIVKKAKALRRSICLLNKNIKMSSFKSSENIQRKEGGPDRSVSDNQSSSVTLIELSLDFKMKKST